MAGAFDGKSVLLAHPDDPSVLGLGPGGTPLLMTLGATSLICVPISDGTTGYGALTLARQAAKGPFSIADLGLARISASTWPTRSGWTGCSAASPRRPNRCRRA